MTPCKPAIVLALLLGTGACNSSDTVTSFAAAGQPVAALLPRVAAIPYNACVERWVYTELSKGGRTLPDRNAAVASCRPDAETRDRLTREFSVLAAYLTVLGKLAGGDRKAAANSAEHIASTSGADASVSGIASAIQRAVLEARTARALRDAIADANPHVQALCAGFRSRIAPVVAAALDNQEEELRALYSDSVAVTPANRVLLYRQFDSENAAIARSRELNTLYATLLEQIAAVHADLYENRDRLRDRAAMSKVDRDLAVLKKPVEAAD